MVPYGLSSRRRSSSQASRSVIPSDPNLTNTKTEPGGARTGARTPPAAPSSGQFPELAPYHLNLLVEQTRVAVRNYAKNSTPTGTQQMAYDCWALGLAFSQQIFQRAWQLHSISRQLIFSSASAFDSTVVPATGTKLKIRSPESNANIGWSQRSTCGMARAVPALCD
jgi:hypothetical protein